MMTTLERSVLRAMWGGVLELPAWGRYPARKFRLIEIDNISFDKVPSVVKTESQPAQPSAADVTDPAPPLDCLSVPALATFACVPASLVRRMIAARTLRADVAFHSARGVAHLFKTSRLQTLLKQLAS